MACPPARLLRGLCERARAGLHAPLARVATTGNLRRDLPWVACRRPRRRRSEMAPIAETVTQSVRLNEWL